MDIDKNQYKMNYETMKCDADFTDKQFFEQIKKQIIQECQKIEATCNWASQTIIPE